MYFVTGTNLYGQWCMNSNNKTLFNEFLLLDNNNDLKFDINRAKLLTSCWSYNIFLLNDTFYCVGAWKGNDSQLVKVPGLWMASKRSNYLITGNDYMLIVAEKTFGTLWFYDFKMEEFKRVKITELPILDNEVKKPRGRNDIIKVAATNDMYIYLTSQGIVYTGVMPSYLDTRHCYGKVIDVECGHEHYMLLTDNGRVYTWGNGRYSIFYVNNLFVILYQQKGFIWEQLLSFTPNKQI